jgi:hypothetical protein
MYEMQKAKRINTTYRLSPSPISGHEIVVTTSSVCIMLLMGCIIKGIVEVGVRDYVMDKVTRVTEPDIILGIHPRWNCIIGPSAIEAKGETIPWDIADGGGINSAI